MPRCAEPMSRISRRKRSEALPRGATRGTTRPGRLQGPASNSRASAFAAADPPSSGKPDPAVGPLRSGRAEELSQGKMAAPRAKAEVRGC